jgi:hypothetical protein
MLLLLVWSNEGVTFSLQEELQSKIPAALGNCRTIDKIQAQLACDIFASELLQQAGQMSFTRRPILTTILVAGPECLLTKTSAGRIPE